MKILVHGINFAPELTGVGKYTGEMAEWLAIRGHQVRVVTAPPYYPGWKVRTGYHAYRYSKASWQSIPTWRCPVWVPGKPSGLKRLVHLASFAASSLPIMLRQVFWRPDLVWVAEPTLFCAPTAWLTARLSIARLWLHVQDLEVDAAYELSILQRSLARSLVSAWERWMLRRFDRVSSISLRMMDRLEMKGVKTEHLVFFPNWADSTVLNATDDGSLRSSLGVSESDTVILYSGTMNRKQGLDVLAEAARRLRERGGIVFVFCGDGPERARLQRLCEDLENVRFLDLQPAERIGQLLRTADIHVLPQESGAADLVLPSKLTNMLGSGRPVVATCDQGTQLAEVLEGRGLVVTPGDVPALVDAIVTLAGDEALRARLGGAGREYAKEHLDREKVLTAFERELLQSTRRRGTA